MVALLEDLISGEAHCYLRDIVCLFGMSGAMSHWLGVCGTNVRVFLQVLMYVRGVVCLVHGWWRSPDLFTCRSCWSASDPVLYDPSPTVPKEKQIINNFLIYEKVTYIAKYTGNFFFFYFSAEHLLLYHRNYFYNQSSPQAHILYSMPGLDWNLYSVHH